MIFHTIALESVKRARSAGVRNYAFIRSEKNNRLNRHRGGAAPINPQRPFFPSIIARLPFPYIRQPSALRPQNRATPAALCRTFYVWSTPSWLIPISVLFLFFSLSLADLTYVYPLRTDDNSYSRLSVVSFALSPLFALSTLPERKKRDFSFSSLFPFGPFDIPKEKIQTEKERFYRISRNEAIEIREENLIWSSWFLWINFMRDCLMRSVKNTLSVFIIDQLLTGFFLLFY